MCSCFIYILHAYLTLHTIIICTHAYISLVAIFQLLLRVLTHIVLHTRLILYACITMYACLYIHIHTYTHTYFIYTYTYLYTHILMCVQTCPVEGCLVPLMLDPKTGTKQCVNSVSGTHMCEYNTRDNIDTCACVCTYDVGCRVLFFCP